MLAIALGWCLWPTSASALQYPCSGAGPGERLVGVQPASNGLAEIPLCVRVDDAPPAPPPPPSDSYAALAFHHDAAAVWVEGNFASENDVVENPAVASCNAVMGGGCIAGGYWSNSVMAIIRDRKGYLYKGWLGDGGAEYKQALAACSDQQPLPCEVIAKISSGSLGRSPGPSARKSYAASAWIESSDAFDSKIYIASGHDDLDEAAATALKACNDASSAPCEPGVLTGGGFIQTYRIDGDSTATAETSAKRAQQAARAVCKTRKAKSCEMQALFDSRKRGLFVHDFAKPTAP